MSSIEKSGWGASFQICKIPSNVGAPGSESSLKSLDLIGQLIGTIMITNVTQKQKESMGLCI